MVVLSRPLGGSGASGKSGPLAVYGDCRGVAVARSNVVGRNPGSVAQGAIRGAVGDLAVLWGSLTPGEVSTWVEYSKSHPKGVGEGWFYATGFDWFVGLNETRLANGLDANRSAPVVEYIGNISDLLLKAITPHGKIKASWILPVGFSNEDFVRVDVAGPHQHGNYIPDRNEYRVCEWCEGNRENCIVDGLVSSVWYWLRVCYFMNDGQRGEFLVDSERTLPWT